MRVVAYGKPAPQGSKRAFRNKHTGRIQQVESSAAVKPWRERLHSAALDALDGKPRADGPLTVVITFWFDRPKNHYRTGKNAHLLRDDAPAFPDNKGSGDIDKLQRACLDALTSAGVWRDDSQVVEVHASKRFCDAAGKPRAVIDVYPASILKSGVA